MGPQGVLTTLSSPAPTPSPACVSKPHPSLGSFRADTQSCLGCGCSRGLVNWQTAFQSDLESGEVTRKGPERRGARYLLCHRAPFQGGASRGSCPVSPEPSQTPLPWSYTGPPGSAFQIGIFPGHLPIHLKHIHPLTPGGRGLEKAPRDGDTVVLLWAHANSTRSGFWTLVSEGPFHTQSY